MHLYPRDRIRDLNRLKESSEAGTIPERKEITYRYSSTVPLFRKRRGKVRAFRKERPIRLFSLKTHDLISRHTLAPKRQVPLRLLVSGVHSF